MKMSMEMGGALEMRQAPEKKEIKTLQDLCKETGIYLHEGKITMDSEGTIILTPEVLAEGWQSGLVFNKNDDIETIKAAYEAQKKAGYEQRVGYVTNDGFEDMRSLLYRESIARQAVLVTKHHQVDGKFDAYIQLSQNLFDTFRDLVDSGLSEQESLQEIFSENEVLFLPVYDDVGLYFTPDDQHFGEKQYSLQETYDKLKKDKKFIDSNEQIVGRGEK